MQLRLTLTGIVMLLSASDNVRTHTATVEDRLKAEVAAAREGQEGYSKSHTLKSA